MFLNQVLQRFINNACFYSVGVYVRLPDVSLMPSSFSKQSITNNAMLFGALSAGTTTIFFTDGWQVPH